VVHSPPPPGLEADPPLGVGVATVGGTVHLGFRYLRTTFDDDAAAAFASLYLDQLDEAA
jgi:hypothetical protein